MKWRSSGHRFRRVGTAQRPRNCAARGAHRGGACALDARGIDRRTAVAGGAARVAPDEGRIQLTSMLQSRAPRRDAREPRIAAPIIAHGSPREQAGGPGATCRGSRATGAPGPASILSPAWPSGSASTSAEPSPTLRCRPTTDVSSPASASRLRTTRREGAWTGSASWSLTPGSAGPTSHRRCTAPRSAPTSSSSGRAAGTSPSSRRAASGTSSSSDARSATSSTTSSSRSPPRWSRAPASARSPSGSPSTARCSSPSTRRACATPSARWSRRGWRRSPSASSTPTSIRRTSGAPPRSSMRKRRASRSVSPRRFRP